MGLSENQLQQEGTEQARPVLPTLPVTTAKAAEVHAALNHVNRWYNPPASGSFARKMEAANRRLDINTLPEEYARANIVQALSSEEIGLRNAALYSTQDLQATLARVRDMKQKVDDTMALLVRETRAARLRQRRRVALGVMFVALAIYLAVSTHGQFYHIWWMFNLGGGIWAADQMAGARRDAATTLRDAGDPRAVGVLAIAARDGDPRVRIAAVDALRRLMPRLRASDAGYITSDQMAALIQLGYGARMSVQVAVLQGLKQVGDERAVPLVKTLMADPREEVRREATECLEYVERRIQLQRESSTLLRASSGTSVAYSTDNLLRPSSSTAPEQHPEQLLRPGDRDAG